MSDNHSINHIYFFFKLYHCTIINNKKEGAREKIVQTYLKVKPATMEYSGLMCTECENNRFS